MISIDTYCIYRLVQASGTTYDGVGGWGGMLTFMWTCGSSWCYAHAGWGGWGGWGGMSTFMWTCGRMLTFMWTCGSSWCYAHAGWGGGKDVNVHVNLRQDVNVHVNLRQQLMLRTCGVGGVVMMMMMMMMMTLMKLVNSATKFRHGMDKFY